jgi:PAS domain S-box-containing protein
VDPRLGAGEEHPPFTRVDEVEHSLGFMLAGTALLLLHRDPPSRRNRNLAAVLATVVVALGTTTILEYATTANLGIDELLLSDTGHRGAGAPGRMSLATAIDFVLLGLALLMLDVRVGRKGTRPTEWLAVAAALIALTSLNPVAERLTGWMLGEARGQGLDEVFRIFSEVTEQAAENPVERVLRDGVVIGMANHTVLVARDGTRRPIADSGAPIRDVHGALRGVVLAFRDMTEERRVETELRQSQARFARLAEAGIIGIGVADLDGTVHEANEAFLQMVGMSLEDVRSGKFNWSERTPPAWREADARAIEQLQSAGVAHPWEKELIRTDGTVIPVLIGVAALEPPLSIAFLVDLTERKRIEEAKTHLASEAARESKARRRAEDALQETEEQLRQSQKMEAVGRLAGGVAHDFNNLLSVILSYSSLLSEELKPGDPRRDDLEEVRKAGERATQLTRQLLAFSRRQVLEPKVLEIDQVVSGMEKFLRRLLGEDVELSILLPDQVGRVFADPGQLERAGTGHHVQDLPAALGANSGRRRPHSSGITGDHAGLGDHPFGRG